MKFTLVGLLGLWMIFSSFDGIVEERLVAIAYIDRFSQLAVDEMNRVGIPASIKLAQAVVESNAGRSNLAMNSNNHFGIKCKSYWTGLQYFHKDDDLDKNGKLIESCFRAYQNIENSFRDHSDFLRNSGKYDILFSLDKTDYKGWAWGLKSCGYATDRSYAEKLIRTIEEFKLYRFDTYQASEYDVPKHSMVVSKSISIESTVD